MIINEFNFIEFYQKAFSEYGRMSTDNAKRLCEHLKELGWDALREFCGTTDLTVALISFTNQAYLIATEEYYYTHGEDFASIEEQIKEAELIATNGANLEQGPYSLDTAWPAEYFRKMGMITGDEQWNGIFRSV